MFRMPPLQSFLNSHRLPREFDHFAGNCDLYVDRTFDEIKKQAVKFAISFTNLTACKYYFCNFLSKSISLSNPFIILSFCANNSSLWLNINCNC